MCHCLKYDVDSYLYLRSDLISVYFTVIISFASQTYCLNYRLKYKVAASSQGVELKKVRCPLCSLSSVQIGGSNNGYV